MVRNKNPLFNEEDNERIRNYMKEFGHYHNRFVRVSKLIPKYTPKQISNHWRNYLNPDLCHEPLGSYEKNFIIDWIHKRQKSRVNVFKKNFENFYHYENIINRNNGKNNILKQPRKYQQSNDIIPWKNVVRDLENQFNKRYSENKVRNFWNSRQKSILKKSRKQKQMQKTAEQKQVFILPATNKCPLPSNGQNDSSRISIASLLNDTSTCVF
ncbi:kinase-like domain-containing protein [Rhizophagus clarus]|uniref:Kinase-like domain-containing protein n=1 Tax=Rhizophagus clarus TaxID=94130 RepID=A0A8H3MIV7_9GLOM|nr:kinase-like domain-containing protein [Rhizophagus clarus]